MVPIQPQTLNRHNHNHNHITMDCPDLEFTNQKVETHFKSQKEANGLKCHYIFIEFATVTQRGDRG